ncbi:hypothetical protein [Variovorax saccharolyticus]|uniref:hypothetical protein n=1 Tax=Variovorax saccharolyticus TaxID=3053516 RepID=UPI002574A110|nr:MULTISPECIES: hypothetical protein [unclassified Variovorax]MDM0022859.1 hypothetical protein [Variovorax sp. J22R187]MDM0029692.1 hypothetical protein [Variovorax sp. J31P216]
MKQSFNGHESQWSSARRHEQLATERQQLQQEKFVAGWKRNFAVLALVAGACVLLVRHFA